MQSLLVPVVWIVVILYASVVAPAPPPALARLMHTVQFRILMVALIAMTAGLNMGMALVLAIGFIVAMNIASGKRWFEYFDYPTNVHPDARTMTAAELLKRFHGDEYTLRQEMRNAGVPFNLPLDDDGAPSIATYLKAHGALPPPVPMP